MIYFMKNAEFLRGSTQLKEVTPMVSSRSWKNSNFNRILSLALCVGVAFLLLAGSVFAQGTTLLSGSVNAVALQAGKINTMYEMPAGFGTFTRQMGVARQVASGNFFVTVTLPAGFVFNAAAPVGNLPEALDLGLTVAGGGTITVPPTIFSGGIAGSNNVKYQVEVTGSFETAPTFTLSTAGWRVTDTTGVLSGITPVTVQLTITTADANTGTPIDTGGVDSANFIAAVNGLPAAPIVATTATVDTAAGSARKNFVVTGGDTIIQDNGATVAITVGSTVNPVHTSGAGGSAYQIQAGDSLKFRFDGNLSGVKYIYVNTGAAAGGAEVKYTVLAADVTNGFAVVSMSGANGAVSALANATSVAMPITFEADGTTQLTARSFTLNVYTTIAYNAANNSTILSATNISTWGINGPVLMANWANANTGAWKSRFYIFNETASPNATVIVRMFQIPISANNTAPTAQIGTTVTLGKTLGAVAGMTIRLEDIITASGALAADLAGPDNSYNVAVEITVYTQGVGSMVGGVTGYAQTFNLAGTVFTGTTPLSKIQ
jgi:hypothetical protein